MIQVQLFDATGRMVIAQAANGTVHEMPLSTLPKGMYMVIGLTAEGEKMSSSIMLQ